MDMLNKIRSAVSGALPGNPLSKHFEIGDHIASGGPCLVWKIFKATKRTTKEEAAIFVFDKKTIEKYSKRDKELILESLRKGVSQLTRLRHPKILSVLQPLEESRENLAFATEPVFASLANVLKNSENAPNPQPKQLSKFELYDVEIKHGLLQVMEAVAFLHGSVKLMHSNICPENIIINKNGCWKMAGFDCCMTNANPADQSPMFPFREWDPELPPMVQPCLDYLAPEYALTMTCGLPSDMFSIGILVHTIFNNGKPLYECKNQLSLFKKYAEETRKFRSTLLGNVPAELHEYVKLLLNTEPTVRPDPDQLSKIPFFEDVGCVTLQFMDSLFQRDNLSKSQFFKGLPNILAKLPKRVNIQRILPNLQTEAANADMVPFLLPSMLQISDQCSDSEFVSDVLPILKPIFQMRAPIQIMLILMQNMNILLKKTPQYEVKNYILPLIHASMESNSPQLQELCLTVVPTVAQLIEFSSLKNSIIPRVRKLCITTQVTSVRTNCMLCIGKLLEYLDKWTVLDDVLPMLPHIPSKEPAVLMSILGIYQVTLNHPKLGITKDIIAQKVLPFIIPMAIDNNLNLKQFNTYMTVIRDMLGRMETDQQDKLAQLEQMKQEQQSIPITQVTSSEDNLVKGIEPTEQSMMDQFMKSGTTNGKVTSASATKSASSPIVTVESKVETPISQPSKTLSIEDKQKLAKQQEQQRMYKTQKPLTLNSNKAQTGPNLQQNTSKQSGVKDLSSSLMNSSLSGFSSANKTNPSPVAPNYSNLSSNQTTTNPNYSGLSSSNMTNTSAFNSGSSMSNSQNSSLFHSSKASPNSFNMMGQSASTSNTARTLPAQNMNMGAFDSLLPSSNQPRPSLNQISSTKPTQQPMSSNQSGFMGNNMAAPMGTGINFGQSQAMIGNRAPSMGMNMGQPTGMMSMGGGNQMFGAPQQRQFNNQGFMNQAPMGIQPQMQQGMGGMQLQPQQMQGSLNNSQNSSSNDLSDIFG